MVPGRNEFQEPLARIVALSPQQWAINALAATKNEFFLPPSMCWMRSFLNSLIKRAHVRAGKRQHPAWAILSFPCYIGIRIVLLSVRSAVHPDCLWSCHWFPFIPLLHVIDCSSSLISIFNFNKTANVGWWCLCLQKRQDHFQRHNVSPHRTSQSTIYCLLGGLAPSKLSLLTISTQES